MGVGHSGPTGDGVIVTKDVQQLARTNCQRNVPVELHIYTGLDHRQAASPSLSEAQSFLAQRFENLPFHNGVPWAGSARSRGMIRSGAVPSANCCVSRGGSTA
jgi:hypothetical protein